MNTRDFDYYVIFVSDFLFLFLHFSISLIYSLAGLHYKHPMKGAGGLVYKKSIALLPPPFNKLFIVN